MVPGDLDGAVAPTHSRAELRRQGLVWVACVTVPIVTLATVGLFVGWRWDPTGYHTAQHAWFLALNDVLSSWPTVLWSNLTLLGDGAILLAILSPLLIWHRQSWGSVLAAVPFAALLSGALKKAAAVPRPGAVLDPDFTVIGDLLTGHNSFPSGHAITVFTAAVAVLGTAATPNVRRWWYGPSFAGGFLVAAMVGLSRVAVGAHWPLDVAVGAALGWIAGLCGVAAGRVWQARSRPQSDTGRLGLAALVFGLSVAALFRAMESEPGTPFFLWLAALCGAATTTSLSSRDGGRPLARASA